MPSRRDSPKKRSPQNARRPLSLRVAVGAIVTLAAVIGVLIISPPGQALRGSIWSDSTLRAAIVDQLSLTVPNPNFVASATAELERAGYTVDYYPGSWVTVDFYRDLPTRDYNLIVMRVHAGLVTEDGRPTDDVSLFTGEEYSDAKYVEEQGTGLIGRSVYTEDAAPLFGIGPDFINYGMQGKFDDTLIVMMGCDGLRSQKLAKAFLDRGAESFVSWSQTVSAEHTDASTLRLLENLLTAELPVPDAVRATAEDVGPDPYYGAELRILAERG